MAFIFPFNAGKFTVYGDAGETTKNKLSLAVRVIDGVSDQLITDGINVSLLGDKTYQPVQNLSGYYCFNDISPGKYKLIVNSNVMKEDLFNNVEESVDIPLADELNPVLRIVLTPKPSYQFSSNATLIRGMVIRKPVSPTTKGEPVVNAQIVAVYQGEQDKMETHTDQNGEFVLLIKKIKLEAGSTKIIKNISIDIKDKDGRSISIETNDLLKNGQFLEGGTGVIVIEDFPMS